MTLSQAWLCSARARSPGSSCGGQIEGSSTQAGFQLNLLDIYSDHFCWIFRFSRCALQYLPVTGATGQLAQHFGNLWCAHLQTGLKLYLRSELSSVLNTQYSLWSPQIKYLYCHFMGVPSRGYSFCTSAAASVMTQFQIVIGWYTSILREIFWLRWRWAVDHSTIYILCPLFAELQGGKYSNRSWGEIYSWPI